MELDQRLCFFCTEVIVRAEYPDGYQSEWVDLEGYRGCGTRGEGDHTPDDPNGKG